MALTIMWKYFPTLYVLKVFAEQQKEGFRGTQRSFNTEILRLVYYVISSMRIKEENLSFQK